MGANNTTKGTKSSSPPPSQVPQVDLTGEAKSARQTQHQAPTGPILQAVAMSEDVMKLCKIYNTSLPLENRPQRVFAAAEDGAYMHAIYMVCNIQSLIQNEQWFRIKMTLQHDLQCSHDAVTKLLHDAQKWVAVLDLMESREMVTHHLAHPIV